MSSSTEHSTHDGHTHSHGQDCGHAKINHGGHTDYLHDGHLHNVHGEHVDEHTIEVSASNPSACVPDHLCQGHEKGHRHGKDCGHESVPHGDHTDYLVDGHLHHAHGDHCDDHGKLQLA